MAETTEKKPKNPFAKMLAGETYHYIVAQFMKREPVDERAYKRISNPSGQGSFAGGSDHDWTGGPRMYTSENGRVLYSYGTHFPLAEWIGDHLVVNADWPPSQDTHRHQTIVRNEAKRLKVQMAFIPYSVLRMLRIDTLAMKIIAATPDFERKWERKETCKGEGHCRGCHHGKPVKGVHTLRGVHHFLGETLFTYKREGRQRFFVCGLDRNDDPVLRKFFICRLPLKADAPLTVDAALEALRPPGLSTKFKSPRQGEWFFSPVTSARDVGKVEAAEVRARVPITSAVPAEQRQQLSHRQIEDALPMPRGEKKLMTGVGFYRHRPVNSDGLGWKRRDTREERVRKYRYGRHVAERMVILDDGVYVKGVVRDDEHSPLDLGPVWHRVVRNLADGSWAMPEEKGRPARVD